MKTNNRQLTTKHEITETQQTTWTNSRTLAKQIKK